MLFFLFTPLSFALSSDAKQPIMIEADTATIDDANGIAIYEGNVIVTQGSIRINAAKVTLRYTERQDLEKVVAEGNPAKFKQTPDGKKPDLHANSKRMEYLANENMLHLTKQAKLWQGDNTFTGDQVMYDTKKGIIRANKGSKKGSRVTVTINPKNID